MWQTCRIDKRGESIRMDLLSTYPAISDLRARARRRLPRFVWDFLDSGTGQERCKTRNRRQLDRIGFCPQVLTGPRPCDLTTRLFGRDHALPFGIAPVGMSGLVWRDAERLLAQTAAKAGIPYTLSTVACQSPEEIAPHLGEHSWFQLYPPKDPDIRRDLVQRIKSAGFSTLVLTVDVPVASRRERQTRSGLTHPPSLTPRLLGQIAMRPAWAMQMARADMPRMRTLDKYTDQTARLPANAHIGYLLRTAPDIDYVKWLRDVWDGPFVIKGILRPEDATLLESAGVDGLWVSNHAGRQFDGAPASIDALTDIRAATRLPLIFDSGVESGLDIMRAFARGADFVMLGRAFHYGLAALGGAGAAHVIEILRKDLEANMGQLGATTLRDLPEPIRLPP